MLAPGLFESRNGSVSSSEEQDVELVWFCNAQTLCLLQAVWFPYRKGCGARQEKLLHVCNLIFLVRLDLCGIISREGISWRCFGWASWLVHLWKGLLEGLFEPTLYYKDMLGVLEVRGVCGASLRRAFSLTPVFTAHKAT